MGVLSYPIGNFVGKYWRQLVAVGIGIVTAGIASGAIWASLSLNSAAAFGVAVAGGALAGYVSTGTLNGALIGAFSAAAFYGVGSYFDGLSHSNGVSAAKATAEAGGGALDIVGSYAANASLNSVQQIGKVIAHGVTGGVMSKLSGGRFAHGFASAGTTQAFAKTIGGIGNGERSFGITAARVTSAAIVGGAASELSGGKFANGAVTGAFSRAFNDEFEDLLDEVNSKEITDETARSLAKRGITASSLSGKILFKNAQGRIIKTIRSASVPFINLNIELLNADIAVSVLRIQARLVIDGFYNQRLDENATIVMRNHLSSGEFALLYLEFARNNFIPINLIERIDRLGD